MHRELCKKAVEILQEFGEVEKIILYGSVYRGNYKPNSDIDLAVICKDFYKTFLLEFDGTPIGLRQKIKDNLRKIPNPKEIKFHTPIYWNFEFDEGIELYSKKNSTRDLLHEVGLIVYNFYDKQQNKLPWITKTKTI